MSWFLRRGSPPVATRAREEAAWAQAAHELEQLRISTANGLDRLRESPAQAKSGWDKAAVFIQAAGALAIIIPVVALIVSINQFNQQQKSNAGSALQQQRASTAATLDQQRQATLSSYLDDMSVLVLQYNLPKSKPGAPVRAIAVARTLTALRDLDGARKATLIRYLWEAGLLAGAQPVVNIHGGDLSGAIFDKADLDGVALFQTFLDSAQFVDHSSLVGADLSGSYLYAANLTMANLSHADLRDSLPVGVDFAGANLQAANLTGADLTGANLTGAQLSGASLKGASYNAKPEYVYNRQGKLVLENPTKWPLGTDPRSRGAICSGCTGSS